MSGGSDVRDASHPGIISLAEWASLSGRLEKEQLAAGCSAGKARSAYIGRAAVISLLLVNRLHNGGESSATACVLETDSIALEIGDSSFMECDEKSIETLSSTLESVTDVRLPASHQIDSDGNIAQLLPNLGSLLYQLFSHGRPPPTRTYTNNLADSSSVSQKSSRQVELRKEDDEEQPGPEKGRQKCYIADTCKSLRRVHITDVEESLAELLLPASISTLLRDLLEPGDDEYAFHSLVDVLVELKQIIDQPHIFLYEDNGGTTGELQFGDVLVGRTDELRTLLEAAAATEVADDEQPRRNTLVMIQGDPGLGKSYLVESLSSSLMEGGWIYLSCKFDRLIQATPLSTISAAFERFFQQIILLMNEGRDADDDAARMIASIQNNLTASGIVVLSALMPTLCTLYPSVFASIVRDDTSSSSEEDNAEEVESNSQDLDDSAIEMDNEILSSAEAHKNRLHYLFRRLVQTVSSEHPVLFFFDDLQWVDESSIQLLSSLFQDSGLRGDGETHHLLVVGSYRPNEVDGSHILSTYIPQFEDSPSVNYLNIRLDALAKGDANILVSEALRQPGRQVKGLSDVLYLKTGLGNPLHLKSLVKSLVDDKTIFYSLPKRRWVWDIAAVSAIAIDDDVAVLMTRKLRRLSDDVQEALKLISCFGLQVAESTLRIVTDFCELQPSLEDAVQEGILEHKDSVGYRFHHDTIHQAVYDLMGPEERGKCHFAIGLELAKEASSQHFHPLTFAAADQINLARTHIDGLNDHSMHIDFAKLNLVAGERSIEVSDFVSALNYLSAGISFLPETASWEKHYELSLRLHESVCLACYITARPDKMTTFLGEIFENSKSFMDKLKGLFILVQFLTSTGRLRESIEKVFVILEELGEEPLEATPEAVHYAMASAEKALAGKTKDYFLSESAPRCRNEQKHWVVKLLTYISPFINMAMPGHSPLIACRIVTIMVNYGVCSEAAFGLLQYGDCIINIQHDVESGYGWGRLGLKLLESFGAKNLLPCMKIRCAYNNFCWVDPLQSTASILFESYREALSVGDNESGMLGALFFCSQSIFVGAPLPTVNKDFRALASEMVQLNQLAPCLPHLSNYKLVLTLLGSAENPFHMLGDFANDEDELLEHSLSTGRAGLSQVIRYNRLCAAFFLKRYEEAAKYAETYNKKTMMLRNAYHIYYAGLTAFHYSRVQPADSKWMEMGENAVTSYRFFIKHSTWNWENKCMLLEAECHYSKGETEEADKKYTAAIESARKHRFVHEEGLANELCSVFHNANGHNDRAKSHIVEARVCYEKWGARALVDQIDSCEVG